MKMRRLLIPAFISLASCVPAGGFLLGFVQCQDCGWNPASRSFIGLVYALLTTLTFGFPPKNEGGVGAPFNAWPYIAIAAAAIFIASVALTYLMDRYES
jgi:hypothetical protein